MTRDPMLDGITRFGLRGLPGYPTDDVVVVVPFSDLPALLAAVREDERGKGVEELDGVLVISVAECDRRIAAARVEVADTAMQIGRQIEKDNHAAGLCEPSYTHGREYQQQRLTNHDMHSGLACLTNYEQGQRDEREACIAAVRDTPTDPRWNVLQIERAFIAAIRARGEKS